MAVAWISWRTVDDVREAWPQYRSRLRHWQWSERRVPFEDGKSFGTVAGWTASEPEPASFEILAMNEAYRHANGETPAVSLDDARKQLWERLASGQIEAFGLPLEGEARPSTVPAHEWSYLILNDQTPAMLEVHFSEGDQGDGYREIRMSAVRLMDLWPKVSEIEETQLGLEIAPEGDGKSEDLFTGPCNGDDTHVPRDKAPSPNASVRSGRKPKFDWPEYERAFFERLTTDGFPDLQNIKGWQSQADVAQWLQKLAERDRTPMSDSAAKRKARELMDRNRS